MKLSTTLTLFFLTLLSFVGCDISHNIKIKETSLQDTSMIFKSSLDTLKQAGFAINPQIQEPDIFNRWKEVLVYHSDPN